MKVSENIIPVSAAEEKIQDRFINKISVRDLNAYFGSVKVLKIFLLISVKIRF